MTEKIFSNVGAARGSNLGMVLVASVFARAPVRAHANEVVQKQGAQLPPPGTHKCSRPPQSADNAHTLSSALPLPEKAGRLLGKPVCGKTGEHIGDVQAEVTPQGCTVTAVLIGIHGFIGIGGKQIEIPMTELKLQGNRLIARRMTARQIIKLQPVTARKDTDSNVRR
jgi:PRC-barrel domain